MRYHALAADFDGTLAHDARIDDETWDALRRLRDSGRKLIVVTGRRLDELLALLPPPDAIDRIVAENGALVYDPATRETRTVGAAGPPERFIEELRRRGVEPLSVGRTIVATREPHEAEVLAAIRELGLELHVIFNKGAVMVLPSGVNKATGLAAALLELGLSPHNVVAVGDAENDHALLAMCECGAAVANALDALKERADLVLRKPAGAGVGELIEHLLANDLAAVGPRLGRHRVLLGKSVYGDVTIDPYEANIVVCGTSGSGKSTLTNGLLERLSERGYQYAIVDPEGDYGALDGAVALGSPNRPPLVAEVLDVLKRPTDNVSVNLLGVAVEHRPAFFAQLLPALSDLRTRTGRPHWLVIDEAHHLLPASWEPAAGLPPRPHGTIYITVHPESVSRAVLATIDTVIAVGEWPDRTIRELCESRGIPAPPVATDGERLPPGHALCWRVGSPEALVVQAQPTKAERTRHSRKYMEGNLGRERSFYFRGADGRLNLAAHNLQLFLHLGDGVDDETWLFHLGRGDYSTWLRAQVKDDELAAEVERIEREPAPTAAESRAAVRAAVEKRYTLPADKPSGIVDPPAAAPADGAQGG